VSSADLDPIANPQAWDYFTIQGVRSPGLIPLGGFDPGARKWKWDKKVGKGAQGGTSTYTGRPPAEGIKVKLHFWTAAHFLEWQLFLPLLKYDPTKKAAAAVSIYYPSLTDIDVRAVVVESIVPPKALAQSGLFEVEIEFSEFAPVVSGNAVATPKTAKDAVDETDNPFAKFANSAAAQKVRERIAMLTNVLNKLTKP
jgi:hypothetical protein